MRPNHYRVSIDNPYLDYALLDLPVESPDGETKLGKAKGYFVQWPANMVIFEDQELPPPHKKAKSNECKERVDSSGVKSKESSVVGKGIELVDEEIVKNLTESCELLYWCMTSEENMYETTTVPLKAPLFYQDEDKEIYVTSTDVSEFLRGAWANVSLIHVYMLYLYYQQICILEISEITFLCPQRISETEIEHDYLTALGYIKKAFLSEIKKGKKHCKFILAPYVGGHHWVLLVIDLQLGLAFDFDPATPKNEKRSKYRFAYALKTAYKVYLSKLQGNVSKQRRRELLFKEIECPQQNEGTMCGYYVMRYMYEIVTAHNECKGDLEQDYCPRKSPYTDEEINLVREHWASFYRRKYLLGEPM